MADAFISYRHADATAVTELVAALRASGLSVWFDDSDIEDFASIQQRIETGLQQAKVLVAWYSVRYPESPACQWELTTAFVAGQQEGDPRRRVLIVNPDQGNEHIHPIELRDARFRGGSADAAATRATAEAIVRHVATLTTRFDEIGFRARPRWHGTTGSGSNRFVGRLHELCAIHSGLAKADVPIIESGPPQSLVWLTGMAGAGKSLAAEMYALRFGAAYPGGVFWLKAYGHDVERPLSPTERDALRDDQIIAFSLQLGLQTSGLSPSRVRDQLGRRLDEGGTYLWIVDDLPSVLDESGTRAWLAPGRTGRTLITTRGGASSWAGSTVTLGALDDASALRLLTHRRRPADDDERAAAEAIVRDLGGHALALELAAVAVQTRGFATFHASLQSPTRDALDFAAKLIEAQGGQLPHRERSNLNLSITLSLSIDGLPDDSKDVLRLAALLAAVPIPRAVIVDVFRALYEGREDAEDRADIAVARAATESLAREMPPGHWLVHGLVARTVRLRHADAAREAQLRKGAVTALNRVLDDRVSDVAQHDVIADAVAHARTLLATAMDASGQLDSFEGPLLDGIYVYDVTRGNYGEARRIADRLIDHITGVAGPGHRATLGFRSYIGRVLRDQGNFVDALAEHERLYEDRRRVLGDEDEDTLTSLADIGVTLHGQGQFARAKTILQQVLQARVLASGANHVAAAAAMHDLAMVLSDAGQREQALALQEQAVRIRRRDLGDTHPLTMVSLNNLSVIQGALRNAWASGDTQNQEDQVSRSDFRDGHPADLTAMNNLAATLDAEGRHDEARALLERCLAGRTRLLGRDHPDTLATVNNLAAVQISQADYGTAVSLLEDTLERSRRTLGATHPLTFQAAYHLFVALGRGNGSPDRRREVLTQDLSLLLTLDPADLSPEFLDIRSRVAKVLRRD